MALEFSKTYLYIDITLSAKKSLLFHDNSYCVKRNGDKLFGVEMEISDGAEIDDLVDLYI